MKALTLATIGVHVPGWWPDLVRQARGKGYLVGFEVACWVSLRTHPMKREMRAASFSLAGVWSNNILGPLDTIGSQSLTRKGL